MTSDQQRQFEHMWPALSVRLHRLLSRKKVSPWLAEDLVQETGLRLIRMWPQIDQAKPLWPLTATIGLNLFRDEMRRAGSKDSVPTLPDSPSAENVEERGMARVELSAVGGALAQMSAPQRDAILADISEGTATTPLASSVRMMRMRARRRLQHLMDHASVLGIALGIHMRKTVRELELVIGRILPTDAERATAAAVSLFAAISLGVAVSPPSPSQADEAAGRADLAKTDGGTASSMSSASSNIAVLAASRENGGALAGGGPAGRGAPTGSGAVTRERDGATDAGETEAEQFPGTTHYALEITEDTYIRGGVEADVFGRENPSKDVRAFTPPSRQLNCTVAPSQTGASCVASENGTDYTGARAQHRGEARIAGRRIL